MAAASRRRRDQRQRQRHRAAEAARRHAIVEAVVKLLPAELHCEIHHRLDFQRRLAFASICVTTGHMLRPEPPCLFVPGETEEKATVLSMAEGSTASVRTTDLAMLGHVVIGSTDGWFVTADDRGALRMANPANGARADLPAITTIPFLNLVGGRWFCLDVDPFVQIRFRGPPPPEDKDWGPNPPRTSTLTADQMRQSFYRKVVLSASPSPGSYAAMLITDRMIGAPAFATADDPTWRMAHSPEGVEDAIHHDGRFYSITYAGCVEAWQRNNETGEFTSQVVAPRLVAYDEEKEKKHLRRKYLAASTDGRLMAVLKRSMDVEEYHRKTTRVSFEVQVLDQASGRWEPAADIGDAAVFVGVNGTVCVSTREHPGINAGCIYFTDDEVGDACLRKEQAASYQRGSIYGEPDDTELRETGVYSLKAGRLMNWIHEKGKHQRWPPQAWFTPSFL